MSISMSARSSSNAALKTMRALTFTEYAPKGPADYKSVTKYLTDHRKPTLRQGDARSPHPEYLVRTYAASFNPIDKMRIGGDMKQLRPEKEFPAVIGYDVAGVVEEVQTYGSEGSNVELKFKVGDRIVARMHGEDMSRSGGMADYCVLDEDVMAHLPDSINFTDAAGLGLAGQTVLQAFREGGVKQGDRVMITAGAGGVGTLAIQIAKNMFKCSEVIVTCSPGPGEKLCKELGADKCVNYREVDMDNLASDPKAGLEASSLDFCLALTPEAARLIPLLKPTAKVVAVVGVATLEGLEKQRAAKNLPPFNFFMRQVIKFSLWVKCGTERAKIQEACEKYQFGRKFEDVYQFFLLVENGKDMAKLVEATEKKEIRPVVDQVFKMQDAVKAMDRALSGHAHGKVVVDMSD
eukprot:TRINITY_DN24540_c0_g1_i1.p1 TRINITY_DN24540_c0_g1~~TRINITY_DN24540_c0_g1_i1.p1  ORF type:complete len:414 (-),score=73.24 TRINITY_DN24540_c0_g1_i1:256-1476(-)